MFFIEAQPFERNYSQSQQIAAAVGGGGDQDRIRTRSRSAQKEIIAATWNQIKGAGARGTAAENAAFLSGVQSKLRDQAHSLAERMKAPPVGRSRARPSRASPTIWIRPWTPWGPAADKLKVANGRTRWRRSRRRCNTCCAPKRRFRDIQVAFGSSAAAAAEAAAGRERDLEGLFDLELDTEKNQYESGQRPPASDQQQRDIDEALAEAEAARAPPAGTGRTAAHAPAQTSQQRWQQEMLRREAEQLRRAMEQLSRAQGSQQPGTLESTLDRLQQAEREMRQAGSPQSSGTAQGSAQARRAAERLADARKLLSGMQQQRSGREMDDLVRQADDLAARQRAFENKMRRAFGDSTRASTTPEQARQLADEKQGMVDDVKKVENGAQQAARTLAGAGQPRAATKLREALGNLQQEELAARMRWSATRLRQGLGAFAAMREALTTQTLDNLAGELREARKALAEAPSQPRDPQGLEQALAQAEQLRRELEKKGAGGREPGAGPVAPGYNGADAPYLTDLSRLGRSLGDHPELAREVQGLVERFRGGDPRLLGNLNEQLLAGIEQVELELRRMVDEKQSGKVRGATGEAVPPAYADAVAEYFRRLSRE